MSDPLEFLIRLFWMPFEIWQKFKEDSRIGASPLEDEASHFWLKVGLLGTTIVGGLGVAIWLFIRG